MTVRLCCPHTAQGIGSALALETCKRVPDAHLLSFTSHWAYSTPACPLDYLCKRVWLQTNEDQLLIPPHTGCLAVFYP